MAGSYYRARYYDPVRSRFVSEDPLGLRAGDPNHYAYAMANPVSLYDPLGLWTAGFGFQLSGGAGAGGSFSAALVVDGQGQVGLAVTGGAGGAGGMGGSLVVQGQGSNANTIQQLRGPGGSVSVSAGEGVVGQGEVFVGDGYIGGAGGIGIGGGLPVSVNGELTYTKVWCIFNCRDNRSVRPGTDNGPQTSSRLATPGPCNRAGTLGGRKQ